MRPRLVIWAILIMTATLWLQAQVNSGGTPTGYRDARYAHLPLMFEGNQGQTTAEVKFLSRGPGYTAYLTSGSMVLSLHAAPMPSSSAQESGRNSTVQLTLLGAAKNPAVTGENLQPGKVNYFLGSNPAKWHTNVPTYGSVRYHNVYPGIDLVYHGSHSQLQYEFEAKPGSDPRQIRFEIQGATQIGLNSSGELVLQSGGDQIRLQRPMVYRVSQGIRIPVDGSFVSTDSTHVAFEVGRSESSGIPGVPAAASEPFQVNKYYASQAPEAAPRAALYPVLGYATYLGGTGTDQANGLAVDSTGAVYIAGYTNSSDFPLATLGSLSQNSYHAFVAKLDPSGNLVYADYIGGNNQDYGIALALDSANDVWVTGSTQSSNFPVVNAYQSQQPGPYTGFVTQVSADGSSLLYSTYLGGSTSDQPSGIAIDGLGQAHVAGFTQSQNFPVANAYQPTALPNQVGAFGTYGFLTTFSADGSSLIFSTYLAGNTTGQPCGGSTCYSAPFSSLNAIAVDANGNSYVTGSTNTYNFPTTSGAYQTSNNTQLGNTIGSVSKFNGSGGLEYSTYFYGSSGAPVTPTGIAVDGSGLAFITGTAYSDGTFPITTTSICDPGTYGAGCGYAFVSNFDAAAATLLYSTFLGPNNYATPQAIAIDGADDAYVLSSTSSSSFQTNNAIEAYSNQQDLLLVEIDPAATTQLFSTYFGGSGYDSAGGLAIDGSGNIYMAGSTDSVDLPITQGAFQSQLAGGNNTFVAKIGQGSAPTVSLTPVVLQFSEIPVGSSSSQQQVLARNMSSLPLTISSISATGDFSETDNCGTSLPAAGSCTLSVTFTPTAAGSRTGSLLINDTAVQSPQQVSLVGIGLGAAVALSPTSLTFPSTQVGVSSAVQTIQVTNQGNANLNIASVQITGDYTQTNNCPSTLAAGSSCTISITFTPTVVGSRPGTLSITDSGPNSPQTVALSGTGSDFSLTSSPNSVTVAPGATAAYTVTVAPLGGAFSGSVKLTCSGAPALTTCSIAPTAATPGSSSVPVAVTISTTGTSALAIPSMPNQRPAYAVWMQLPGFGIFGMLVLGSKRGKKNWIALIALALLLSAMLFMPGCAGGTGIAPQKPTGPTGPTGTAPGTYTVTITGTSGSLQHTLPLTLIVQ